MNVEVWSDLVCPWCYLGRRRLETVLPGLGASARVTFRAYQLDPDPVLEAVPVREAAAAKFGDRDRVDQMFAQVTAIAAAEGLVLDFGRAVAANTFDAHRLVAWAAGQDLQHMMIERLQRAYFAEGVDLGSWPALADLAAEVGLDRAAAVGLLESGGCAEAVHADLEEARELGIVSVPTLVVDRRFVIQGAQEAGVLRSALSEIARREAVDVPR